MLNPITAQDVREIISDDLPWERLKSKTVIITGAAGFLPTYLVECILKLNDLQSMNCTVVAVVRNMERACRRFEHHGDRSDLMILEADVSRPLPDLPKGDFVIHAASQASPKFYGVDPVGTMGANILGTQQLLEKAVEWRSDSFLFFSSGEVYGQVDVDRVPTGENDYGFIDICHPRSCYAESKRAAETLGVSYASQFGVPFKTVRPFHTYGPGMSLDDGRVFADFVSDIVHNRSIVMKSDGSAVRSFCYLSDAVRAFFAVLFNGQVGHAYNVGNPDGALSILQLSQLLVRLRPGLTVERLNRENESGYLPSPIVQNVPDISRIRSLGWAPRYGPEEGFERTVKSFL
jgi:UDP-glucuronate decarboxylase